MYTGHVGTRDTGVVTTAQLALIALVSLLALHSAGCATTWALTQLSSKTALPFDENAKEQIVPLPGVEETLAFNLILVEPPQSSSTGSTQYRSQFEQSGPLRFECGVTQTGRIKTYRAATRYGRKWMIWSLTFAALESLVATLGFYDAQNQELTLSKRYQNLFLGYWMAADAVGSVVLGLVPARDTYRSDESESKHTVRTDCPEGMTLTVDGRTIAVDAVGQIGELGRALLTRYLTTPPTPSTPPLAVRVTGYEVKLQISALSRCHFARDAGHEQAEALCAGLESEGATSARHQGARDTTIYSSLEVPLGTFSSMPTPAEPAR